MTEFWTMGPTAAALGLRAHGFSPRQAERLVRLKLRWERGDFRELTDQQKRLLFARWLVEHGWLDEGGPSARERPLKGGLHDDRARPAGARPE